MLVSVGLIEKLQLSNSRKPVFRWRNRSASAAPDGASGSNDDAAAAAHDEQHDNLQVKLEIPSSSPTDIVDDAAAVDFKSETASSIDLQCDEDTDALKTSQSCDSDSFDDGSDSQSDCSESGSLKRKYNESGVSSPLSSDVESESKRAKTDTTVAPPPTPAVGAEHESVTADPPVAKLLRFDASSTPVHPQIVLHEQQELVRVYMQQYIREYVDYLIGQQARVDPSTAAQIVSGMDVAAPGTESADIAETSAATIAQSIQSTPVTIPSLTNRVTSDMAGSIQDLLFSTSTTSPQAVSDLILSESRAASHVTISPPSGGDASPPLAPGKAATSTSSAETRTLLLGSATSGTPSDSKAARKEEEEQTRRR